jgi:hypothetical protein
VGTVVSTVQVEFKLDNILDLVAWPDQISAVRQGQIFLHLLASPR